MRTIAIVALLVAMVVPAVAGDTIAGILADPSSYDRKHVAVTGMVTQFVLNVSAGNASETFKLCAGNKCVNVVVFDHPAIANGMYLNVAGLFSNDKKGGTIQATDITP